MQEDPTFSTILIQLRQARDLSQSDLARAVKVHRSRVSEWEGSTARPSPEVLDRLSEEFGLDVDYLLRVCGYRSGRPQRPTDADEVELLALYRQVPPEKRPQAKDFVGYLAVNPTQRHSSGRTDATSKRFRRAAAELDRRDQQTPASGTDGALGHHLGSALRELAHRFGGIATLDSFASLPAASL